MDHRSSAREILSAIGGKENLVSAAHCATRLRLIIADNSKIQKDTLENIDVVKGVFEASGQLQIIIGTGTVNKVYDEFIAEAGVEASSKDEVKAQVAQKQNWFKRLIKTLGDVFVPIIPAIVAGGLIMGIMEALNFMASNGFISLDTNGYVFTIFKLLSNAAFTFLPILIGYSATKVFGGNPYLGADIFDILICLAKLVKAIKCCQHCGVLNGKARDSFHHAFYLCIYRQRKFIGILLRLFGKQIVCTVVDIYFKLVFHSF